jgi:hypothetical protein
MQAALTESVPPRTSNPNGKPNGRPPFAPTDDLRKQVEFLAGIGLAHHKIAQSLGISPTTLRKHFREPLNSGAIQAKTQVLSSLFDLATKYRNTSAAIFYAKTRCGFRIDGQTEPPKRVKNPSPRAAKQGGF